MKKFKLLVIAAALIIGISGCEEEETLKPTSSSCNFTDAEADAYYNLAMRYANNPTSSNCSTLKQASFNLIEKFKNCDAATKTQIAQLTQQWKSVDCNALN